MLNKLLLIFLAAEFFFVCTGGLLLATALVFQPTSSGAENNPADEATCLLLRNTPLTGAIANAVLIFITFAISIPGILMSKNRTFLRVHSWMVLVCGLVTLIIGLLIWFSTLKTRANLGDLWAQQPPIVQSILQKEFRCCGYSDANTPPFVVDQVCPNTLTAARLGPCLAPFSSFANNLLDVVFTAMFGIVALDGILFLSTIVVLKDRAEKERYRLIDAKSGFSGI